MLQNKCSCVDVDGSESQISPQDLMVNAYLIKLIFNVACIIIKTRLQGYWQPSEK
jgi:hypothetical protein